MSVASSSDNILIYLHGFNSAPQSFKAQQVKGFIEQTYPHVELMIPQIALTPLDAWRQLETMLNDVMTRRPQARVGFVGSSLGGFFATKLANQFGGKCVLINPAVTPFKLIELLIGEYTNQYTGHIQQVTMAHGEELELLQFDQIKSIENYWVLLQQGDETLDYRLAVAAYSGTRVTLEPLGDHSFIGFNRYLNSIVEFLFEN
ncbi:YqiA/YcfP family alpha/beta fold hydrolase [Psychrobium sp. 1_MG-2023]|uniref:YqiA/YcfP family alpha/beta fold hydrolase n=1 Tax=Psychrobium sp. 1_MG-2023 TaxID=3062624 RepID=UPI002698A8EA|nr:YqiA/YcfP family alpha/beta fold hydrolase [Psychrobium sp. 1_MG-2023]MDP2561218.1 YqiA/YcfP family alpha/beta fold hydrolase [Psychrobium sp. 1_MG-2023]